jgi:ComF family protein
MQAKIEPYVNAVLFPSAENETRVWRRLLNSGVNGVETQTNVALCLTCAARVRWIGQDRCRRCGDGVGRGSGVVEDCTSCRTHPPAYVKASCAVALYAEGPLRDIILALKFSAKLHLALPVAKVMAQRIRDTGLNLAETIIVPVPVTRGTLSERSFNQAQEIATLIARELTLPLETKLLQKIRGTAPQAVLTHEKRRTNLKDAFACNKKRAEKIVGKRVLLIDDVITTCGTVSECARTLVAAGINEIFAASLARG